jgi:predicted TIM-barrel fold metal-dependent hydrolase
MEAIDGNCTLEKKSGIKALLGEMDRHGIERAVIGPAKNFYAVENKIGNQYIAAAVHAHPDRFLGFAVASPWYGKKAIAELERARELGHSGLKIFPAIQGFLLTDPQISPLMDFAEKADWPVWCATGTPICAMPLQLAELAEAHPGVRFIMGHGGFCDFWNDIPDALDRCPNLWIETSYILPSQITAWIETCGIKKFVYGSDHPFSSMALELQKISLLKETIDKGRILGRNILSLLGGSR